jgi:hypothetical protein
LGRGCIVLFLCFMHQLSFAKNTELVPSTHSLVRQNKCADQMYLERIQDMSRVAELAERGTLSPLLVGRTLAISPTLPKDRRYVLPMVNSLLLSLSEQYYEKFGISLIVDSAVRDADTQRRLRRINYAAAPADGETASVHETGAAIDLSKRLTGAQLRWLRSVLIYYQAMNVAVVEEERRCFHIVVIGETE